MHYTTVSEIMQNEDEDFQCTGPQDHTSTDRTKTCKVVIIMHFRRSWYSIEEKSESGVVKVRERVDSVRDAYFFYLPYRIVICNTFCKWKHLHTMCVQCLTVLLCCSGFQTEPGAPRNPHKWSKKIWHNFESNLGFKWFSIPKNVPKLLKMLLSSRRTNVHENTGRPQRK